MLALTLLEAIASDITLYVVNAESEKGIIFFRLNVSANI